MKQKKILFINIGWEQHPTIELLIKKKFKIYGVCFDKENIYHNYFEKVLYCKFDEIKKIFKFVKQIKPDGVISDQCDFSYKIHSLITTKFKLLGPKFNNAKLFTNKLLQRKLLQKSNFKVPNFFSTTKSQSAGSFSEGLRVSGPITSSTSNPPGIESVQRGKVSVLNKLSVAFTPILAVIVALSPQATLFVSTSYEICDLATLNPVDAISQTATAVYFTIFKAKALFRYFLIFLSTPVK